MSTLGPTMLPPEELFRDLLKRCLTRTLFPDESFLPGCEPSAAEFSIEKRTEGLDWPTEAETMISLRRLDNVQACIVDVRAGGLRRSDATHLAGRLVSRPAASRPTALPGG